MTDYLEITDMLCVCGHRLYFCQIEFTGQVTRNFKCKECGRSGMAYPNADATSGRQFITVESIPYLSDDTGSS